MLEESELSIVSEIVFVMFGTRIRIMPSTDRYFLNVNFMRTSLCRILIKTNMKDGCSKVPNQASGSDLPDLVLFIRASRSQN